MSISYLQQNLPLRLILCFFFFRAAQIFLLVCNPYLTAQLYQSNNLQDQTRRKNLMMQIQSLVSALSYSAITNDGKIHSSIGTEATSGNVSKKKISLCSCSSSISLQQNLEYTQEKELFARYLFENNHLKLEKIFWEMNEVFSSENFLSGQSKASLVDVSQSEKDIDGKVLSHFINIWLRHMGYGTKKNKSHLLSKVKLFLGFQALSSFSKIYDDLNTIPLPKVQRRKFWLETCRNGWEFFIQWICKRLLEVNCLAQK